MTLFSSTRERYLWLWTVLIVAAIYATLGLAPSLAGFLRDRGLLDASFVLAFAMIVIAILMLGWQRQPSTPEIALLLGIVAVYIMLFVRMAIPEERTHLIEYGVVAVFIHEALRERQRHGRRVLLAPAGLALLLTVLIGWLDEGLQALLPNRVYDIRDVFFNVIAALLALSAKLLLAWLRQRLRGKRVGGES